VGVLYGGRSGEHEVSIASAASVLAHLDRTRYEPVPIRIERDGRWVLADRPPTTPSAAAVIEQSRHDRDRPSRRERDLYIAPHPGADPLVAVTWDAPDRATGREAADLTRLGLDVVFPVLHGPYGEDGTVQGLLEVAGLPYVGAGVLASALGMDKAAAKVVFAAHGLPTVDAVCLRYSRWVAERDAALGTILDRLTLPVFVKPANLGSSVGISKARSREALAAAIDAAFAYDTKVLVEAAVPDAREIECAVLGNDDPEASVPGEVVPSREFYDYAAKYLDGTSTLLIPAPLAPEQTAEVKRLALAAFRAIDGAGMARVDFLLARRTGALYVNEVNTIPGFTTISMYPKLWEASGLPYSALLDRLITLALERHAARQRLRTTP
jgi:D-alanine-D-alanine ligase